MKLITIKQFEPGELTAQEEGFYQEFSGLAGDIAARVVADGDYDQLALIAGITRALMQVAGNALDLANRLGVDTDV
jgi:hypothetical protein